MNCLSLVLYLMLPCGVGSVVRSLPAPVNFSVTSVNFTHVLSWDPGPGTPPGTKYMIFKRVDGRKRKHRLNSTETSFKLKLGKKENQSLKYHLTVQAYYNQTLSPESDESIFTPYEDTKIDPPKLSLSGYGNYIQINMSLPEADKSSGIDDIQKYYDAHFRVLLRKEKKEETLITRNRTVTLNNLEEGMQYCVQVHTEIRVNKNTEPSAWVCTFTSIVETQKEPVVLGALAALLIFVLGVLMITMFCLLYTGLLCTLRANLPRTLIPVPSQGYTLTPEGTISDPVSISPETKTQKKHNNPTMQKPSTGDEDDDEEEEEGIKIYMDRDAHLSSGESSCLGSGNMSRNSEPAVSGNCGSLTEWLSAEVEVPDTEFDGRVAQGSLHEDEAKNEGSKISVMHEEGQTGLQGHGTGGEEVEEMRKKDEDSSSSVNLFSVTLAALDAGEEEEEELNTEDSLTEFRKSSDLDHLLPTIPEETGCEGRHADSSGFIKTCDGKMQHQEAQEEGEEEEEEDNEFCGYMAHK